MRPFLRSNLALQMKEKYLWQLYSIPELQSAISIQEPLPSKFTRDIHSRQSIISMGDSTAHASQLLQN